MRTDDLIQSLASDRRPLGPAMGAVWWAALALAIVAAAGVFWSTIGPRADFWAALETVRFPFKFVVTIALAAGALALARALARPGARLGRALRVFWIAPALLGMGLVAELLAVPPADWAPRAIGGNALVCLTFIPAIGLVPLGLFVAVLRHGAPTRPALAGAVAGVLAGAVAATFYAAHCTDDSPLFVALWYGLAIMLLAALGAIAARAVLRW